LAIGAANGNRLVDGNDYSKKPPYLGALEQNNFPRYDWGPKKRVNRFGLYTHLNTLESNEDIALRRLNMGKTNGVVNEIFEGDHISNNSFSEKQGERF
jgi:hypothetical protein